MLLKLKIAILSSEYRTQSHFATCCGKGRKGEQWISRIIQGRDVASPRDRKLICKKLRVQDEKELFGN